MSSLSRRYKRYSVPVLLICVSCLLLLGFHHQLENKLHVGKENLKHPNADIQKQTNKLIETKKTELQINAKPKVILAWNGRFKQDNFGFPREPYLPFVERRCAVTNCVITDDKTRLNESDAVMFHIYDSLKTRPSYKLPHQRWVFFMQEPPCHIGSVKSWNGYFNWTMTYRSEDTPSNIPFPYGNVCKRYKPVKINFQSIVKQKTKLAAWIVGNCLTSSKREDYVRELMKYIPVDVFGRCGEKLYHQSHTYACSRSDEEKCMKMLEKDYKFYLSFENNLVPGYITEKYFKILGINVVPIVRGDGDYTAHGLPHAYINTKDFDSPKKLADYLKLLNDDDDKYIEYLKWKETYKGDKYEIMNDCEAQRETPFCMLCNRLNDPSVPSHVYDDIEKWWGSCRAPTDLKYI